MKVESGRGVGSAGGAKRAGAQAATGFAPEMGGAEQPRAVTGVSGVTALDAVLALQGEEDPMQRRGRQARRGRAVLDVLEDLAKGLLHGRAPAALRSELERLQRGSELTGDEGLDDVMREIDTRLAVEVAKLERQLQKV
ncbi:MAG: flagellar assembly protein FliX [Terricaulis sp.]